MKKYNTWELDDQTVSDINFDLELYEHGYDFSKNPDNPDNIRILKFVKSLQNNKDKRRNTY